MPYFPNSLQQVLDRSFAGKQTALGVASDLGQTEIGRLVREESPITAVKLAKLCAVAEMPDEDKRLLVSSAVRDFVPPEMWQRLYSPDITPADRLREAERQTFVADHPISPRAAQVLNYILRQAQSDSDVVQALELLGKFLELPEE